MSVQAGQPQSEASFMPDFRMCLRDVTGLPEMAEENPVQSLQVNLSRVKQKQAFRRDLIAD